MIFIAEARDYIDGFLGEIFQILPAITFFAGVLLVLISAIKIKQGDKPLHIIYTIATAVALVVFSFYLANIERVHRDPFAF